MLKFLFLPAILCLDNGLALTPQMGWNTWNKYGCTINEELILSQAKALASSGLSKLGYEYVLIDDCWMKTKREKNGRLEADPVKFPKGMKHLTDEIHKLGLKAGIYNSAGTMTCAGFPGSLDHEEIDAKTWAEWGFDYLKYDNCYSQGRFGTPKLSFDRYNAMSTALLAAKRPILYSMCNWGEDQPWAFASTIANSWRISGDIIDNFDRDDDRCPCTTYDCKLAGFHCSVLNIVEKAAPVLQKNRKGGWADLDMLEVGNGGMTFNEYVSHFSLWAFLRSPLILGNDLTNISPETMSIIANKHIIAINQDPLGEQAVRVWKNGDLQLWSTRLVNNAFAILVLNGGNEFQTLNVSFADALHDWPDYWNGEVEVFGIFSLIYRSLGRRSVNGKISRIAE